MEPGDSGAETATALAAVLTPGFLRKLDRLHLRVQRSLSTRPGNTPMPRGAQGSGLELESYKTYGPGDDLRHLDWNAYGRLDQLLVKTFRAEREAPLHIFIDASASMGAPATDNKFGFALGLAASLAYISLRNNDPVRVVALTAEAPPLACRVGLLPSPAGPAAAAGFPAATAPVAARQCSPRGSSAALREQRSPGVAVVLSDFLTDPEPYEAALRDLVARRFTVAAVRVIGPGERDPASLFRRGQLVDAETGQRRFITFGADNRARYQRALAAHLERLRSFCTRSEIAVCRRRHRGRPRTDAVS